MTGINEEQCGFRKDGSLSDQIFVVTEFCEKGKEKKMMFSLAFTDLGKVYSHVADTKDLWSRRKGFWLA